MNDIQIFNSSDFGEVRTIVADDGEPRFCLADVCKSLGLLPKKVSQRLDKEVLSKYPLLTAGGEQQALFVNEDGLYDTILDSRKPAAKAFRKWITSEVIPSIRKTGGYIAARPEDTPEEIMARALLVANTTIERHKERITQLESQNYQQCLEAYELSCMLGKATPKARYYDEVMRSASTLTSTQVANTLGMDARTLHKRLHEHGVIYRRSGQWLLHRPYCKWGLHSTSTVLIPRADGTNEVCTYTVWTQRGAHFIRSLVKYGWNTRFAALDIGEG